MAAGARQRLTGAAWKPVCCERCQARFASQVTRAFDGPEAERYLAMLLSRATDEVPCPKCFSYNADAVGRLRAAKYRWLLAVCFTSLACNVLGAMFPLLFVCSAVTGALFITHEQLVKRHDPNAAALLARRQAVLSRK